MTGPQRLCSVLPPDRHAAEDLEWVQRCRDALVDVRAAARAADGGSPVA